MKNLKLMLLTASTALALVSCSNEDRLKWPKAKGVIVDSGDNGRIGKGYSSHFNVKFLAQDGKEYTGQFNAETTFTTTNAGDSVSFYYDPKHPETLFDEDTYDQMKSRN